LLYAYCEEDEDIDPPQGAMVEQLINLDSAGDGESALALVQKENGTLVRQDGGKMCGTFALQLKTPSWITVKRILSRLMGTS